MTSPWIETMTTDEAHSAGAFCYRAGRQESADPATPDDEHDRPAEWVTMQTDGESMFVGYYYEVGTEGPPVTVAPLFDTYSGVPKAVMKRLPDGYDLKGVADTPVFAESD